MSVVVPLPACSNAPVPLIALAITSVSLWFTRSVALFVTAPLPSVPVPPPLPSCSTPALRVVVPL